MKVIQITLNNATSVKAGTGTFLSFVTWKEFQKDLEVKNKNQKDWGVLFIVLPKSESEVEQLGCSVVLWLPSLHIYPKEGSQCTPQIP